MASKIRQENIGPGAIHEPLGIDTWQKPENSVELYNIKAAKYHNDIKATNSNIKKETNHLRTEYAKS